MENTDLVLIDEKEVYLQRRRQRIDFKKLMLKFFLLLLFILLVSIVVFAFTMSRDGFSILGEIFTQGILLERDDKKPSDQSEITQDTAPPSESDAPSDESNTEESIPNGAYEIKSVTKEYSVTNESEISLELEPIKHISPEEIRKKYGKDAPMVLVTHIFPKESYSNGKYYSTENDFYSDSENVCALAKELSEKLNALGIKTIYLDGEYAKGSIYGALSEYEVSLKETLLTYPSISYVFSLSRGIYVNEDMTLEREVITNDGNDCAQIRVISGTSGENTNEAQKKSISFALDFARFSNEKIKNFVSESKISRFPLGQNVNAVALEIELGTYGSTFSDAKNTTNTLAHLILEYFSSEEADQATA